MQETERKKFNLKTDEHPNLLNLGRHVSLLNDFSPPSPQSKSPPNFRPGEQVLNNAFRVTKSNKSPINVAFPFLFFSLSPSTRPSNWYGLMPKGILQNSLPVYTFDGKRE
ncbi:hypothetical protein CDAR_439841 [Caerostris darwini]|uniref:Uncharacterized protein n=1 Tax=Caerostris darwini TaxID=1538125 RepID=A0AAV4TRA8_9ARAC|nr:hypothetical protein CDAR_439841 [Caerostris darwini]